MAPFCSTELYVTTDRVPRTALAEEPLPEALHRTSLLTRVLCFLAFGRPGLEDHWKSPQSDQTFETVRNKSCSILASTITTASVLLATSVVFISTGSPVSYFDYTSPAPHCLLLVSLMLSVMTVLTSGSSMIRWLHADRQWTQEQLKPASYFVLPYLLSIVTPIFFVAWSLHCFILAMLIAGFFSQNTICRVVTALWLVLYVPNIGTILMHSMWKYSTILDRAKYHQQ